MFVPRSSYLFQGPAPRTPSRSTERKDGKDSNESKTMGLATVRTTSTPKTLPSTKEPEKPAPAEPTSQPVSIPSSPMLIQPRHHTSTRRPSLSPQTQTVMSRGQHGERRSRSTADAHDPNALPPAVAALLAVTAIPPPRGLQRRRNQQSRRVTIDELIQEWRQEGSSPSSEPFRARLDILLEPAGDEDDESLADIEDDKEGEILSSRSVSSDSIADSIASTTPSLDPAMSTVSTLSSGPSTPSLRSRRASAMRVEKQVVSPPTEQCANDHPLRPSSATDSDDTIIPTFTPRTTRTVGKKSSFKSNLTASLNALRSAAKSFSNFTAPSIPSDDMLTRSLFSSHFTNEMRPKDIDGVPDPALRRYLNPTQGVQPPPLSLDDFSSQVQQALAQPTSKDDEPALMIQMQTYSRSRRRQKGSKNVTHGNLDRGEAAVLGQSLLAVRQREPRENSDFLRVVVLELNMRRTGKLDMKSPGRARVWLPARRNGEVEIENKERVPIRWQGVSIEDC